MSQQEPGPDYLGDGVYVSFDGYHIAIHVGDHRNPPVVFLDTNVLDALDRYRKRCVEAARG